MGLLSLECDAPPLNAMGNHRVSSRTSDHADRDVLMRPAARRNGRKRFASGEVDIERYSSEVLRPLTAACVFRDCSLRKQCTPPERRACRTLMRQAALKWRGGLAMGDL